MNAVSTQWQDWYRQGAMYEWWRQQNEAHLWSPLPHPDRRLCYLVAEILRIQHHPHPIWLTELVSQAVDSCGLSLPDVQQYIATHTPAERRPPTDLVREAYRRETMRRHWGWAIRTVISM